MGRRAALPGAVGAGGQDDVPDDTELGRLQIDTGGRAGCCSTMSRSWLTAKEFDLLAFLADDPGRVHRRTEILEGVWDARWYGPTKTLDAHVAAVRKKLGDPRWIVAVRGVGFRFEEPPEMAPGGRGSSSASPWWCWSCTTCPWPATSSGWSGTGW